jgi:hypothetical protein
MNMSTAAFQPSRVPAAIAFLIKPHLSVSPPPPQQCRSTAAGRCGRCRLDSLEAHSRGSVGVDRLEDAVKRAACSCVKFDSQQKLWRLARDPSTSKPPSRANLRVEASHRN